LGFAFVLNFLRNALVDKGYFLHFHEESDRLARFSKVYPPTSHNIQRRQSQSPALRTQKEQTSSTDEKLLADLFASRESYERATGSITHQYALRENCK
jgi:hypothetical protein